MNPNENESEDFQNCHRCGDTCYEKLSTHGHCPNCLYSIEADDYQRTRHKKTTSPKPNTTDFKLTLAITSLVLGLLTVGCGEFSQSNKSAHRPPPQTPTPTKRNFQAVVHRGEAPNDYKLQLKWNKLIEARTWYLHRALGKEELQPYKTLEGNLTSFIDPSAEPGKAYRYLLGYTKRGDFIIYGRAKVRVPKDLHLSKSDSHPKTQGISRVFIDRGVTLYVGTKHFRMHVEEIISNGGIIASRAKGGGEFYFAGEHGTETIDIRAKRARGNLKIVARGYHGVNGDTYPGAIYVNGSDGGDTAIVKMQIEQADNLNVEVERIPGKGGKPAPGGKTGRDGRINPYCLVLGDRRYGECTRN